MAPLLALFALVAWKLTVQSACHSVDSCPLLCLLSFSPSVSSSFRLHHSCAVLVTGANHALASHQKSFLGVGRTQPAQRQQWHSGKGMVWWHQRWQPVAPEAHPLRCRVGKIFPGWSWPHSAGASHRVGALAITQFLFPSLRVKPTEIPSQSPGSPRTSFSRKCPGNRSTV